MKNMRDLNLPPISRVPFLAGINITMPSLGISKIIFVLYGDNAMHSNNRLNQRLENPDNYNKSIHKKRKNSVKK